MFPFYQLPIGQLADFKWTFSFIMHMHFLHCAMLDLNQGHALQISYLSVAVIKYKLRELFQKLYR